MATPVAMPQFGALLTNYPDSDVAEVICTCILLLCQLPSVTAVVEVC